MIHVPRAPPIHLRRLGQSHFDLDLGLTTSCYGCKTYIMEIHIQLAEVKVTTMGTILINLVLKSAYLQPTLALPLGK